MSHPADEDTLPPRKPNALDPLRKYAKDHPDKLLFWLSVAGAFVLGWVLG